MSCNQTSPRQYEPRPERCAKQRRNSVCVTLCDRKSIRRVECDRCKISKVVCDQCNDFTLIRSSIMLCSTCDQNTSPRDFHEINNDLNKRLVQIQLKKNAALLNQVVNEINIMMNSCDTEKINDLLNLSIDVSNKMKSLLV